MFAKDTPGTPGRGLSHIVVKWRHPEGSAEAHQLFDASTLGETVARQRAASRVAVAISSGAQITKYRAYYNDGLEEDLS